MFQTVTVNENVQSNIWVTKILDKTLCTHANYIICIFVKMYSVFAELFIQVFFRTIRPQCFNCVKCVRLALRGPR